jgi:conjugal transfer pilus assembly protein TraF
MVKVLCLFVSSLLIIISAEASYDNNTIGWHWYNEPAKKENQSNNLEATFQNLAPTEQLKILQEVTDNLKDKAILSGNVSDIAAYKKAQDFWVNKATNFTVGWEKMLLLHPELDYSLQHPHENALEPLVENVEHAKEDQAIAEVAKTSGLLFFYRGANTGDLLFAHIIRNYAAIHNISLLPVSVDGVFSPEFKNNHSDDGQQKAQAIGLNYFPALVLVNPNTGTHQIISYGFKSSDELSERLLKISNGWQPNF